MGWKYGRYNYAFNCGVLAFKNIIFKSKFTFLGLSGRNRLTSAQKSLDSVRLEDAILKAALLFSVNFNFKFNLV